MLRHDVGLAFRSLRRNPILSALMVLAIACGIATSMIAITMYHARAGNPIPWKSDELYAVLLDTRDDDPNFGDTRNPENPPQRVTWKDAIALYDSKIPTRASFSFRSGHLISPEGSKPFNASSRITTADFFPMFDVPFKYGGPWTRAADDGPEPVVVLTRYLNDRLFAGANSVGRTVTIGSNAFRVIGVLDAWMPQPRFYDPGGGGIDIPEDLFLPMGWTQAMRLSTQGGVNCVSRKAKIGSFESFFTEDCVWLNYWVELPDLQARDRFQAFVDSYANDQRKLGRFLRPKNNNRVLDVGQWLSFNDVVGDDSRMQVALGGMFLIVCVLNTLGLMLAKFLSAAPISGLRRALGATRIDIMRQHLIEVVVVGLIGGVLGLLLTHGGLAIVRSLMSDSFLSDDNPDRVARLRALSELDVSMVVVAVGLSLLAGVLAGLYPAWRIGRLAPSTFLKG